MGTNNHGVGLAISGLTKRYGDVTALKNVDLTIAPGEFMTFLGPSGSGKTTTLNLIAGFDEPDEGEIVMGDRPLVGVPPHRRNIGVVFQNYALFPHMRVASNIAFPLKERKLKKSEITRKVGAILDTVGLTHLANRYPHELSGGQQQRVALARALVFDPQLLLLDEPLGALDKRLREGLQMEIKRIHEEVGVTFIFVTHDQEEALVMSDRIAVFNEGGLEHVATAQELYEHPRTLFAAEFLGNSNVVTGTVVQAGDGRWLDGEGFRLRAPASGVSVGERAALVIRPERVRVLPAGLPAPAEVNALTGVVTDVVYLGGRQRLHLAVQGREFTADEMAPQVQHQIGDAVLVTWDPETTSLVAPNSTAPVPALTGGDGRGGDS